MKKNGKYVGVDEKYIPEEEKYVDDSVNDEIRGMVNEGLKSAKNYIADRDNQEKMKRTGKKGLKILKGLSIGYMVFVGLMIAFFVFVFVFVISGVIGVSKQVNENTNTSSAAAEENNLKYEALMFNSDMELYKGTENGGSVSILLDNVVTKMKKQNSRSLEVVYDLKVISDANEVVALKKELKESGKYEVTFDYDENNFINKVTIMKY